MAQTPEGRVKHVIRKALDAEAAYYHMPVQNGMGRPSLDFIGCHQGRFFAIEAKAGNKGPTKRQEMTQAQMEAAGGTVFVINEVSGLEALKQWLTGKRDEQTTT